MRLTTDHVFVTQNDDIRTTTYCNCLTKLSKETRRTLLASRKGGHCTNLRWGSDEYGTSIKSFSLAEIPAYKSSRVRLQSEDAIELYNQRREVDLRRQLKINNSKLCQ